MDTATKTGIDAVKTASKRVVQNTAEAPWDLFENKKADKIYIPQGKRQEIINDQSEKNYDINKKS